MTKWESLNADGRFKWYIFLGLLAVAAALSLLNRDYDLLAGGIWGFAMFYRA